MFKKCQSSVSSYPELGVSCNKKNLTAVDGFSSLYFSRCRFKLQGVSHFFSTLLFRTEAFCSGLTLKGEKFSGA